MENSPDLAALISAALVRLHEGESPGLAFGSLATAGGDLRLTAVAVCAASGTSIGEAEQRLLEYCGLFDEASPGEEGIIGEVLESAGYFDHHTELDEAGTQIAKALQQAVHAAGPAPSGWALQFHRSVTTGELVRAFLSIEALWSRRGPASPQSFWAHMKAAARLLGDNAEPGFTEAAQRCHDRLPD